MPHTSGWKARWAVKGGAAPRDMSSGAERWLFTADTVRSTRELLRGEGITGTRSRHVALSRLGVYSTAGALTINPSYAFWDAWLPRILGAAESSDTFAVADTLPEWDLMSDRGAEIVRYNDCKVGRATLRFAPGLLVLTMDVIGKAAVETGNTFPSLSLPTGVAHTAQAFHDSVVSYDAYTNGVEAIREGTLVIDNMVEALPAAGAQYTSDVREGGRNVTLQAANGMTADEWAELYGTDDPFDATIAISYENMSTTISLRNLLSPRETPTINGKDEVVLGLEFTAHEDDSRKEIEIINDPVNT